MAHPGKTSRRQISLAETLAAVGALGFSFALLHYRESPLFWIGVCSLLASVLAFVGRFSGNE